MKSIFRLIVALLLFGGWGLAASALHVVWTGDKPVVIPKDHLGVTDTYVNTKAWTADDVARHPIVVKRLLASGKADVLAHAFKATDQQDLVNQIEDALAKGPSTPTTKPADAVISKIESKAESIKSASVAH
jgi:hypothetical protein